MVGAMPVEQRHKRGRNPKENSMTEQRQIKIFSARCALCTDAIKIVEDIACPSCNIIVADMNDPKTAARASALGITSVPAITQNGVLAPCCTGGRADKQALRAAGIGTPL
jgi:glutaredoxin 3